MMTKTSTAGNTESVDLETAVRRAKAALSAREKSYYSLLEQHDELGKKLMAARAKLTAAQIEYGKIHSRWHATK